jgi:hypothetical protein
MAAPPKLDRATIPRPLKWVLILIGSVFGAILLVVIASFYYHWLFG